MNYTTINQNVIKRAYHRRDNWAHKGRFGKVLICGGSNEYTGSPALVALSALRVGADMTKILAPKRAADISASFSPELISIPYQKDHLDAGALSIVKRLSAWANVMEIGNGLGTEHEQSAFVNSALKEFKKKAVIDADAIKLLNKDILDRNMLLTPNTYEFNLLFRANATSSLDERIKLVKEKAKEYGTNILLKGHVDVVSDGEEVFINKTNSVYMTKGGTGDTLAGMCAGLIAQGNRIVDAACAAAFINGYTGRYVGRLKRESLSPMDIIENIHSTITKWRYQ